MISTDIGFNTEGIFGGEDHFDEYGKLVGFSTDDELLDTSTSIFDDTDAGIDPYSFDN